MLLWRPPQVDHGEQSWGEETPFRVPVLVVTHRPGRSAPLP
jgi:hypothetical protein